jgi:ferric-dicitrate binding protein FerR (iron transport regulator)
MAWHVRLSGPAATSELWDEFSWWLAAAPENKAAYEKIAVLDAEHEDSVSMSRRQPQLHVAQNALGQTPWYKRPMVIAAACVVAIVIVLSLLFR